VALHEGTGTSQPSALREGGPRRPKEPAPRRRPEAALRRVPDAERDRRL